MYREFLPPAPLEPYVQCFWHAAGGEGQKLIAPDGCIDIVVQPEHALVRVVGLMTRAQQVPARESFGVRFRPGAAPAFLGGAPAHLVTDLTPALAEFWSGSEVESLLDDPLAGLGQALLAKLPSDRPDPRLTRAVQLLSVGQTVQQTSAKVALSRQQLTRLFRQHVGTGPKKLARILRLDQARVALRGSQLSPASVAADLGFCDQAHFCREKRALLGYSGGRLSSGQA